MGAYGRIKDSPAGNDTSSEQLINIQKINPYQDSIHHKHSILKDLTINKIVQNKNIFQKRSRVTEKHSIQYLTDTNVVVIAPEKKPSLNLGDSGWTIPLE